ncbi:MAG: orotate phosphoribosyltransferase [Bogoriella megaspora]|nr:MAG: orotate phosphoribosyltransferase [Bogoriella megaspora]
MASATPALPKYKTDFISACLSSSVLTFGTYTLKSKRISPYFFNAGLLHRADLVRALSLAFAHTLASIPNLHFDILFGPAYKGIPIAAATTLGLALVDEPRFGHVSYSFNRKEAKDHGEGGTVVGAPLNGKKVVIIDDVMTAGTAMREAIGILEAQGGELVGIVVAFDRMEKMPSETDDDGVPRPSTIGQLRRELGVPVFSILTLDDVVEALRTMGSEEDLRRLEEYRGKYKASD